MTGHVAQFLVEDADWRNTLRDLHRALVPGGRLAFDTRDPRAQIWQHWNASETRRRVPLDNGNTVEVWNEVTAVTGDLVTFMLHYLFDDCEELTSVNAVPQRGVGQRRGTSGRLPDPQHLRRVRR